MRKIVFFVLILGLSPLFLGKMGALSLSELDQKPGTYTGSVTINPPETPGVVYYYRYLNSGNSDRMPWTKPLVLKSLPGQSTLHVLELGEQTPPSPTSLRVEYRVLPLNTTTPQISLESGIFKTSQKVQLESPYPIYYRWGAEGAFQELKKTFLVLEADVLETKQYDLHFYTLSPYGIKGPEVQKKYVIQPNPLADRLVKVLSPQPGNYQNTQLLVLQPDDGVVVYYTLDGSEPQESSAVYQGPVMLPSGQQMTLVLKAVRPSTQETSGTSLQFSSRDLSLPFLPPSGTQSTSLTINPVLEGRGISLDGGLRFQALKEPLVLSGIQGQFLLYELIYQDNGRNFYRYQYVWNLVPPQTPTFRWDKTYGIQLELISHPLHQIRYTLDGTTPTLSSPVYQRPLALSALNGVALLKAQSWGASGLSSPLLEIDLKGFLGIPQTPTVQLDSAGRLTTQEFLNNYHLRYEAAEKVENLSEPTLNSPLWSPQDTLERGVGWNGSLFLKFVLEDSQKRLSPASEVISWQGDFRSASFQLLGIPDGLVTGSQVILRSRSVSGVLRYELALDDQSQLSSLTKDSQELPKELTLDVPQGIERQFFFQVGIFDLQGRLLETPRLYRFTIDRKIPAPPRLIPGSLEKGILEIYPPDAETHYHIKLRGLGREFQIQGIYKDGVNLPLDALEYYEIVASLYSEDSAGNRSETLDIDEQMTGNVLFLAPGASGTGSKDDPMGDLTEALGLMSRKGIRTALLARGDYLLATYELPSHLRLLGGFHPGTWRMTDDFTRIKLNPLQSVLGFTVKDSLVMEKIDFDIPHPAVPSTQSLFTVQGNLLWSGGNLTVGNFQRPIFELRPNSLLNLSHLRIDSEGAMASYFDATESKMALEEVTLNIKNWRSHSAIFRLNHSRGVFEDVFVSAQGNPVAVVLAELLSSDLILERSRFELESAQFVTAFSLKDSFLQGIQTGFFLNGAQGNLWMQSEASTHKALDSKVEIQNSLQINKVLTAVDSQIEWQGLEIAITNAPYNDLFELQGSKAHWTDVNIFSKGNFMLYRGFRLKGQNFLNMKSVRLDLIENLEGSAIKVEEANKHRLPPEIQFTGNW